MDVDEFRARLHVLAVDDDCVSLKLIERQLRNFNYNVTTTMHAETALEMLRARKNANQFDLVITDVHMPGMDGFKLLELIGLEMDIPVIMLSANDSFGVMMKGINHGARDYLVKPVRLEQIKNLWIHVVRKSKSDQSNCNNGDNDDNVQTLSPKNIEGENSSDHTMYSRKKKKDDEDDTEEEKENISTHKRQRVQWSGRLHRKFVEAVDHIGLDKAVPKKILEIMNVEGLSRENVASHLQKYRLYLKKLSDGTYKCANPFAEDARLSRNPINMNDFDHSHERGGYQPSPSFVGSSKSGNPFARMNSPSAFGTHGLLPTQSVQLMTQRNLGIPLKDMGPVGYGGNLPQDAVSRSQQGVSNFIFAGNSNANISFSSGLSGSSFANISNSMAFNTRKYGPSGTSGNSFANSSPPLASSIDEAFLRPLKSYASLLRGKFEGASRGIPFDADDSFESIADGEMLAPSSNLPVQSLESDAQNAGLSDSGNNSWKPVGVAPSNFAGLGHKGGTSEAGPSQGNRHMINKLSRHVASSGQISEFRNQMAALMRTITPMSGFNEQVPPFNMGSDTTSTAMPNDNPAPTDASSAISTLPNLEMNNSTMSNQMMNGEGGSGSRTDNDGTADQQAVGDQLNDNNESFAGKSTAQNAMSDEFDDLFADLLDQDIFKDGDAFMDEDWEFAP